MKQLSSSELNNLSRADLAAMVLQLQQQINTLNEKIAIMNARHSATERAIRPFTIGRANWHIIDTIHGAQSSAVIYSLVETAKANKLKIYEYLKHLLTEIPKHMDDTNMDFLEGLLPWSEMLPEECLKKT